MTGGNGSIPDVAEGDEFAGLLDDSAQELYDEAPCGYLSTLLDGTIVKVNQTFLDWTGHPRGELVGQQRFQAMLSAGGRIFYETHYAPLLRMQGAVRAIAVDIHRADGSLLPSLVNSVLKRGTDGSPVLIRTTVFDATDRRTYERELLRAQRAAEESEARARAVHMVVGRLAAVPMVAEIEDILVSAGREALGASNAALWLADTGGNLVLKASTSGTEPAWERQIDASARREHQQVFRAGEVRVLQAGGGTESKWATTSEVPTLVLLPLVAAEHRTGMLALGFSEPRTFTPPELALLTTLGQQAGQALERARLHEKAAREARRSAFLLEASKVLAEAVGFADTLERLAEVATPALADVCMIDIVTDRGLTRMAARHGDPRLQPLVDELREHYSPRHHSEHPSARALAQRRTRWSPAVDDDWLRRVTLDERHFALAREVGFRGYITVPLIADDRALGAVTLLAGPERDPFTEDDVQVAEQLAQQVALVVVKAQRYDAEYRSSHTLQASLLPPPPPAIPGYSLAVRYLPGSSGVDVGGDFYDVVVLDHRSIAFVVGDVVGHDLTAAAEMGQLRSVYRALVAEAAAPAEVIERLQSAWDVLGLERLATAVFGSLSLESGELRLASAGHPAPLLVADGDAHYLPVEPSPPLGTTVGSGREWRGRVPRRCTLLLFTDGLIEDRRRDIDVGAGLLLDAASTAPSVDPDVLCDHVLAALAGDRRGDDIALLAIGRSA